MELIPGYKQTEVGVIPEDWETKRLGDLFDFTNGRPHEAHLEEGGRFSLITLDSIDINGSLKRTHKQTDTWDNSLRKGDLVAVLSDLAKGDLLGLCDHIPEDSLYVLNQRMGRLRARAPVNSYFARLQINSRQSHFKARSQGSAQRHVYRRDFDALSIPCPSVPEQNSIANTLLHVDALLTSLDEMISKKRLIKQAAMQELLTGKRRLPGFEGEWAQVNLGSVAAMNSGGTPPTGRDDFYGGDIPWVSISDMTSSGQFISETERTLSDLGLANCSAKRFPTGTILYAMYASLGECSIAAREVTTSQAILGIRPGPPLVGDYLYYWLDSIRGAVKLMGQQGTQSNLNKKIVQGFSLGLPSKPEQAAIANVLSEIDQDIDALKVKAEKTWAIKAGMLQQLLTGKIRLI